MLALTLCMATIFGYPGDKHGGRTPTLLTKSPVTPADVGIAHRTWPIGARVRVTLVRTGKSAVGVVLDRGPYGKKDKDGVWFNSRQPRSNRKRWGRYLGCADLTPAMGKLIGHNGGRDRVRIEKLKRVSFPLH